MIRNILITGAGGQLGKAISKRGEQFSSFSFFYTDVDTLDITNEEAVRSFLKLHNIHFIINAAAYTAVNLAEQEPETAYLINAKAVEILARAARDHHSRMIHISTDYVFNGAHYLPYVETDGTEPMSVYGRTKLAGEILLQEILPDAVIIRTSWLYSEEGNNFVSTMLRLGREKDQIQVVFDQIGSPTYVGDLADTILAFLEWESKGEHAPGIYHFSNEGVCSWYDFALKIMELAELPCRVDPVETKDYPTQAKRPAFSVLNKAKIKGTLGITIPHWEESLKKMLYHS